MFSDIEVYVTVWMLIISIEGHLGVNGALQENMAFHLVSGPLHPEIAILMDMGDNAKLNGMDQHIAGTVQRWIKYSAPEGETIGVAQIGASNKIHLPMTIMGDMGQRSSLASKILPVVHGESNPLKGIHIAEKMISKNGSFIFIVSHKKWEEPFIGTNEKKTLLKLLERNLKIVNIFISMNASACEINELNSNIEFLHISENSLHVQHEIWKVGTNTALAEIMAVYQCDWRYNNISTTTILEKETLLNQDSGARTDISITVFSCNQFRRLEISVQFLCGSSICELSQNFPECDEAQYGIDRELNTSWISYPCSLNGTWNLSILCPSTSEKTSIYKAFMKVNEVCTFENDENEKPLEFNCTACKDWKNPTNIGNEMNLEKSLCARGDNHVYWNDIYPQPVIILSQIGENHHLLEDINITITAEDLSNQMNTYASSKENIVLHDGGWGADKISMDGIYSGYFSPSGNSYNHCLNNPLPCNFSLVCSASGYSPKHGPFQMQIRGPPFQFQKTDESYPPDMIRDLKGEQEGTSSNLKLTWTAAGRSLGNGKVSEYTFQLMEECSGSSKNEYQEDEKLKNKKNESIYFQKPSIPGEISSKTVAFEGDTGLSSYSICFVVEAIGESHKQTKSNCACALVTFTEDSFHISYAVIILVLLFFLLLAICIWKQKKIFDGCSNFFTRKREENSLELPAHFNGQVVNILQLEEQPLNAKE